MTWKLFYLWAFLILDDIPNIHEYPLISINPNYPLMSINLGILIMDDIFLMDMICWESHWIIISQLSPGIPNMLPLRKFHYHRATIVTSHTRVKMQLGPYDIFVLSFNVAVVLTILKKIVNGKDYPIYYGKSKMFETTNQYQTRYLMIMISFTHVSWND